MQINCNSETHNLAINYYTANVIEGIFVLVDVIYFIKVTNKTPT